MTRPHRHDTVVRPLRRRRMLYAGLCGLMVLLALLGAVLLAFITLDVIVILSANVRDHWIWPLVIIATLVVSVTFWHLCGLRPLRVARQLEHHDAKLGTALTNAVQLGAETGATPLQQLLREQTVAYGRQHAARARLWPVMRSQVRACAGGLIVVAILWGGAAILFTDVLATVWPRLSDPFGDHPPYSRTRITLRINPDPVLYGGQCEVQAILHGGEADRLYLVAQSDTDQSQSVMFRKPDRSYFQTLTNLREPTTLWVTDGRARSLRHRIDIRYTPQITLVEVTRTPPAYTRLAAQTSELKSEEMWVPKRTGLSWRVMSNRPLASGRLVVTPLLDGQAREYDLSVEADQANTVCGRFEVDRPVAFALWVTDKDGLPCQEPVQGRVNITPDRRPRLWVQEPATRAVATPQVTVPIRLEAEDDFGVEQVIWFRGLNESVERPAGFARGDDQPRTIPARVTATGQFDLGTLGLRPGDRIHYFFEAVDNDPDGPNIATSRMHTLDIISNEDYEAMLRQRAAQQELFEQYFKLNQMLRRLHERAKTLADQAKDAQSSGAGDSPDNDAARQQLAQLARAMQDYQQSLDQTLGMPALFDVEEAFRDELTQQVTQADTLQEMTDALRQTTAETGRVDPRQAGALRDALASMADQSQQQIQDPAQQIASVAHLLYQADRFAMLTEQQKHLTELARRFIDLPAEPSRVAKMQLAEIAANQQQIHDELRQLLTDMPALIEKLPADPVYNPLKEQARTFLQAVREAEIEKDMTQATDDFKDLSGTRGYDASMSALEKMLRLCQICGDIDMPGQAFECLRFQPKLRDSLGNSLQQILAAMKGGQVGASGKHGYGMYGQDVSLYGPNVPLPGQMGSGQDASNPAASAARFGQALTDPARTTPVETDAQPGRVQLQTDAHFPLRYRHLVGEYFRKVAESQQQE